MILRMRVSSSMIGLFSLEIGDYRTSLFISRMKRASSNFSYFKNYSGGKVSKFGKYLEKFHAFFT